MPNKFPLWKNLMLLAVVAFAFIYAAPNLYPPDPALQLSGQSSAMQIDGAVLRKG
jgi:preprotein translocase subunit SecD